MALADDIRELARQVRAYMLAAETRKLEKAKQGKAYWVGFDQSGNGIVKQDGKEKTVRVIGNLSLAKGTQVFIDGTNTIEVRKKVEPKPSAPYVPTPPKPKPIIKKARLILEFGEEGNWVITYRSKQGGSFNNRLINGFVQNGSSSNSINLWTTFRPTLNISRGALFTSGHIYYGLTGSLSGSVSAPGLSVTGDPSSSPIWGGGLEHIISGTATVSLTATPAPFAAAIYGHFKGTECLVDRDESFYVYTPTGLYEINPSDHVTYNVAIFKVVRRCLINDIFFATFIVYGYDDEINVFLDGPSNNTSSAEVVNVGRLKGTILHLRLDITTNSETITATNLTGDEWYRFSDLDNIGDKRQIYAFSVAGLNGGSIPQFLDFNLNNAVFSDLAFHNKKVIKKICQTAFVDDWIYLLQNAADELAALPVGSTTDTKVIKFLEVMDKTYNPETQIVTAFTSLLPKTSEYADFTAWVEDNATSGYYNFSETITPEYTLANVLSLYSTINSISGPKESLADIYLFEEFSVYISSQYSPAQGLHCPTIDMALAQLAAGETTPDGYADKLGDIGIVFAAPP